jgi:hypothetical protein
LNINILSSSQWLWGSYITSEELFSSGCSSLSLSLCSFLSVVEESVWIAARWNDHGSVGATSKDSFVEHDVLWVVFSIVVEKERLGYVSFIIFKFRWAVTAIFNLVICTYSIYPIP